MSLPCVCPGTTKYEHSPSTEGTGSLSSRGCEVEIVVAMEIERQGSGDYGKKLQESVRAQIIMERI